MSSTDDVPVKKSVSALALNEWAAVAHALLDGRQTVLFRKGGIHENRFSVAGPRFLLFPTLAHSHTESTRLEHAEMLDLGRSDITDDLLVLRVDLEVVDAIAVTRPDRIAELEPFHIWTTKSVRQNRIDFRPRHQLTALVVRAAAVRPVIRLPALAPVTHDDDFMTDVALQVRRAVG